MSLVSDCVCALSVCVCLFDVMRESSPDTGFFHLLIFLWYVRKQNMWLKGGKKSPCDSQQITLICSYTVTTTNPTVKPAILNNLCTDAGGNEVTLVKQLFLLQTLPLVKLWKWNHKREATSYSCHCEMIQKPLCSSEALWRCLWAYKFKCIFIKRKYRFCVSQLFSLMSINIIGLVIDDLGVVWVWVLKELSVDLEAIDSAALYISRFSLHLDYTFDIIHFKHAGKKINIRAIITMPPPHVRPH